MKTFCLNRGLVHDFFTIDARGKSMHLGVKLVKLATIGWVKT
ncbi:hypothetical protein [Umezakia ovalisporum]|nr:hypothetical protein [Umezakia ovalisporum]MDH6083942.1 hypothetical protein [Umezakia ovalisporum TAC611]